MNVPVNIGSDELISINELLSMVLGFEEGITGSISHIAGPQGVRGRSSDNSFIFHSLGWKPSQPLEIGMRITYNWVKSQVRK